MFAEIAKPALEVTFALVLHAAHGCDQDRRRGHDAGLLHNDVEIFFRAEIGGETALIHDVIRESQSHFLADYATRAVGDVPEWPGVHKSWSAVGGLCEIR